MQRQRQASNRRAMALQCMGTQWNCIDSLGRGKAWVSNAMQRLSSVMQCESKALQSIAAALQRREEQRNCEAKHSNGAVVHGFATASQREAKQRICDAKLCDGRDKQRTARQRHCREEMRNGTASTGFAWQKNGREQISKGIARHCVDLTSKAQRGNGKAWH